MFVVATGRITLAIAIVQKTGPIRDPGLEVNLQALKSTVGVLRERPAIARSRNRAIDR